MLFKTLLRAGAGTRLDTQGANWQRYYYDAARPWSIGVKSKVNYAQAGAKAG